MKNKTQNAQRTSQIIDSETALEAQIAEIIRRQAGESYEWVLITQQHDFSLEVALHDSREAVIGDLGDALTCHHTALAVVHQRRRLAPDEIKGLEQEALEQLGPISRAKAKGNL